MLVFLNYTAVLPILQEEWGMRHGEAGLIFSAYQVCYLLAVLVLATLTDRMDTRTIYLASAAWAGLAGTGPRHFRIRVDTRPPPCHFPGA